MVDQEFLRVVASDLNFLCDNEDWDLTENSLRRTSPVLRRLLVHDELLRAWREAGFSGQPRILTPTLKGDLRGLAFAQAGGAGLGAAARQARPPSPSDERLTLTEFLESPCLVLNGTAFNRRELVKYVANKLGGNHFDKDRDQRLQLLDELRRSVKWAHGESAIDAVYHELLSIARLVTSSEEIQLLRSRLNSLST